MQLSREEVEHVASLFRLSLKESEVQQLRIDLADILNQFEVLNELDTGDVSLIKGSEQMQNVMRADESGQPFPQKEILANAPNLEDYQFQVPNIIEDQ